MTHLQRGAMRDRSSSSGTLGVTFDRDSTVPLYLQLKYHIIHAISTARFRPGAPLPSVRAVCRELGLASATVQRAYAELQGEGYLVSEPGRGIFVGGLEDHLDQNDQDRNRVLNAVLLGPLSEAQRLGFTRDETENAIRRLWPPDGRSNPLVRVIFVGRNEHAARKYEELLRAALSHLRCQVLAITQDALAADDGLALTEALPAQLIVSLVSTFAEVRQVAHSRGTETYALMVQLSEETKRTLIELPFESRVALITEHVFLSNTRALVEQVRGHQQDIVWATELDIADLRERLAGADVVLHSLGMTELARRNAPRESRLVELVFLPMPESIAHLIETVEELERSVADTVT